MAIAAVGDASSAAGNESSGTTLTFSPTGTVAVGHIVMVRIACDNTATTDGDHSEISSVADDAGSNQWFKLHEQTNGQGAAAGGITVALWQCYLTTQITSGTTITITFANTIVAKCARMYEFTAASPLQVVAKTENATDGANGFGSLSLSGLPNKEYLFIRVGAKESSSNTALTPTTNYTAAAVARSGANGAASALVRQEHRIVTATTETSNPTLAVSADNASIFVAMEEVLPHALLGTPDGATGQRQFTQLLAQ